MPVISRCRANYQQNRWDEAAALYSFFTFSEWTNLDKIGSFASDSKDDTYSPLRKQVVRLLDNERDLRGRDGSCTAADDLGLSARLIERRQSGFAVSH